MPLVDWTYLDRRYNEVVDATILKHRAKRTEKASGVFDDFQKWIRSESIPSEYKDLLESLRTLSAPGIQPTMNFAIEIFSRWPDLREEVQELQRSNAKLIAERHRYRQDLWTERAKSEDMTQDLKVRADGVDMASRYKEILQNLTRNVSAYRLAREQFGPEHPETIAAFESLEHANTEASKELV